MGWELNSPTPPPLTHHPIALLLLTYNPCFATACGEGNMRSLPSSSVASSSRVQQVGVVLITVRISGSIFEHASNVANVCIDYCVDNRQLVLRSRDQGVCMSFPLGGRESERLKTAWARRCRPMRHGSSILCLRMPAN